MIWDDKTTFYTAAKDGFFAAFFYNNNSFKSEFINFLNCTKRIDKSYYTYNF
jgi:hypothetical protein